MKRAYCCLTLALQKVFPAQACRVFYLPLKVRRAPLLCMVVGTHVRLIPLLHSCVLWDCSVYDRAVRPRSQSRRKISSLLRTPQAYDLAFRQHADVQSRSHAFY